MHQLKIVNICDKSYAIKSYIYKYNEELMMNSDNRNKLGFKDRKISC